MAIIKRSERKTTSIYASRPIFQEFKANCKKTGQSTCHVLEAFMYGFNQSISKTDVVISALPPINVTLNVKREVRRPRRADPIDQVPDGMTFKEYADRLNNPHKWDKKWIVKLNPKASYAR